MSIKNKLVPLIGVAALGLAMIPSANAVAIWAGQYTYINNFTVPPGTPNSDSLVRDQNSGFPAGPFDDYWIFDISPDAAGQLSVNFVPVGVISGFTGGFYNASGFSGCVKGAVCTTIGTIGTMVAEASAPGIFAGIIASLPAGQYAVRVQGSNDVAAGATNQTSYTGQLAFQEVPEPGSLALLGLSLLGLGAVRRRKV